LECISTIKANLQHATIEADIRIDVGGFKIEIVPVSQLHRSRRKGEMK
jgi:hypothetical protein